MKTPFTLGCILILTLILTACAGTKDFKSLDEMGTISFNSNDYREAIKHSQK